MKIENITVLPRNTEAVLRPIPSATLIDGFLFEFQTGFPPLIFVVVDKINIV